MGGVGGSCVQVCTRVVSVARGWEVGCQVLRENGRVRL